MQESNIPINNNRPEFRGVVEINDQSNQDVDHQRIRQAIDRILVDAGFSTGTISIAIVSDATIHELNKRYLAHDYETDVLSFALDIQPAQQYAEGEIVVSFETAERVAKERRWKPTDELLLYVIHGGLHLVGYHDNTAELRQQMRNLEAEYLSYFGLVDTLESPDRKENAS